MAISPQADDDVHALIRQALELLPERFEPDARIEIVEAGGVAHLAPLAVGIRAALVALSASLGECREALPYSPMRPIREDGELRWCCNHNPMHCGP